MLVDKIKNLIAQEIEAIKNIPIDGTIEKTIDIILDKTQKLKGKVVVSGMGKAGQIGHNIATTLSSTGTTSVFIHPSEAQHGDLGILQENDVLFLISNSGKTREILELITLAKNLHPNVPIVMIEVIEIRNITFSCV
jgi:arabinose-5-phosphate isomerase